MSYKLKQDSIEVFSKELSAAICDKFFSKNEKIDGNQLMSITGSKQTNLLLVKALFDKWKLEMAKLESPYFAFEKEEVKIALEAFMKVLSKHIAITRVEFEPILVDAISASVEMHFDSTAFFGSRLVDGFENELSIQDLLGLKKYLKFNSNPFFETIVDIDSDQISLKEFTKLVRIAYQNAVLEQVEPEEFLNDLDASEQTDLLFDKEVEVVVAEIQEIKEVVVEQLEVKPTKIKLIADEEDVVPALNHKFEKSTSTLADTLQKRAKKDIESSLNLNDKFMFIDNLFGGDKPAFQNALKDLESSSDFNDAKSKVVTKYGSEWDMDGEEVEALLQILERRFS